MAFLVLALPRSRTAWLARFLTYGNFICGHEELRHARSLQDVEAWFRQPDIGSAETSAMQHWRLIPPEVKLVIIRRPVLDVVTSVIAKLPQLEIARPQLESAIRKLDRKLGQIELRRPNTLSVDYSELESEETCALIFEHCLGLPHDPKWYSFIAPINIQISLPALFRYAAAYQPQMQKLALEAKARTIANFHKHEGEDKSGVTIQEEGFDTVYRDGAELFRAHCVSVGEPADEYLRKNLTVMRELEKSGGLQFLTARCNGRLFGYLMYLIQPSLERQDSIIGVPTLFYVEPGFAGLGMKLQRAGISMLKARGADEIVFRAGPRGSGPRLSSLYKRLGAVEFGELYSLRLEG